MLATSTNITINWEDLGLAARIVAMDSVRSELVTQTVHALGQDILKWAGKGNTRWGNRLSTHLVWTAHKAPSYAANKADTYSADDVKMANSTNSEYITDIEREFIIDALTAGGIRVTKETYPNRYFNFTW